MYFYIYIFIKGHFFDTKVNFVRYPHYFFVYNEFNSKKIISCETISIDIFHVRYISNFDLTDIFIITKTNIELKNVTIKTNNKEYDLHNSKFDIASNKKGIYFKELKLGIKFFDITSFKVQFYDIPNTKINFTLFFKVM